MRCAVMPGPGRAIDARYRLESESVYGLDEATCTRHFEPIAGNLKWIVPFGDELEPTMLKLASDPFASERCRLNPLSELNEPVAWYGIAISPPGHVVSEYVPSVMDCAKVL